MPTTGGQIGPALDVIPEGALSVKSLGVAESVLVVVGDGRGAGPAASAAGGGL